MTVALRCAGPLYALRVLARLYGQPVRSFERELAEAARALVPARDLPRVLAERTGSAPRRPTAIHFFTIARTPDPAALFQSGLAPGPDGSGPHGELIRELVLRSVDDRVAAADGTIPCLVEFARLARDVDVALAAACAYVEAALRGATVRRGHAYDGGGAPVPASSIVTVRALDGTEREWTPG